MLEQLRQNQRNFIIYVLFGIIIAAFIISFGPGGRTGAGGGSSTIYVARVADATLTERDLRVANLSIGGRLPDSTVLDKLIERELLADEAERVGLRTSAKEAEDSIAAGRIFALGLPLKLDSVMKDGRFEYEKFKTLMQNQLGVTPLRFVEIQQRELLADRYRELLRASTKVTQEEVKSDFEQKNLQVNLEYVRYQARRFEDEVEVQPADIEAYKAAHKDEIKKQFDERPFLYKKLDKQAKLRHILLEVAKDAPQAKIDAAQKQAEAIVAKLKGGASFAEVAQKESQDERSKKRGGLVGWKKKEFTPFGKELEGKIWAAKKGDLLGPTKIERGFEIVLVEDFREGDVPFEAAEAEIAEDGARKKKALERAKVEADATLARLQKGEKFEAIVPKAKDDVEDDAHAQVRSDAPKLAETGLFARRGDIVPDVGLSPELAKRAFEMKPGEVAGPFEVTGAQVVVRAKERKEPDLADYEKRKDELRRTLEREKWKEVVDAWSKQRCVEYKQAGKIKVNQEALANEETGPLGKKKPPYEPCSTGLRLPF